MPISAFAFSSVFLRSLVEKMLYLFNKKPLIYILNQWLWYQPFGRVYLLMELQIAVCSVAKRCAAGLLAAT
jgi:hypothetical protein